MVCPVLVGRDDLLAHADRRLADAVRARGELLFLAGEAGIGKTRLLAAFEAKASGAGFRRLKGAAFPRDLEVAAAPFVDLARSAAGRDALPGLLERLLDDERAAGDAHRRRRLLVLDVAERLASLAEVGRVLIALEDLHWADDLSLEILAGLARLVPQRRMLVLATYRSDELYPRIPMREWRARLLTQRLAEEVRIPRLPRDAVGTMTTLLSSSGLPAPLDLVEAIHDRTDGIPLHVEEFVGAMAGGAGAGATVRAADVPDTLDDAIRERLGRRSAAGQATARAAAVIGRSFDLDVLADVLGQPVDDVAASVAELADHFVLAAAEVSGRFDFRHALIRDALYASIPLPERRRLHARVADVCRANAADDAFVSLHLEAAGRTDEAFTAAIAAGQRAMTLSSRHEAYELFNRALRNRPADLPLADAARLLETHGTAAAGVDDNETAAGSFLAARDGYFAAGLPSDAARVVAPYVAARHLLGDDLETRAATLRAALAEVDALAVSTESTRARAKLLAGLSAAYMLDRRLEASIRFGEEARRAAVDAADEAAELDTLATVGSDLVFSGRMDDGWAMLEQAVERARGAHREAEAARAYRMIGSCASVLVEYERATTWLRAGIEYAERVELWNHRHYMAAHLGHVAWATGRWDEAESLAAHALSDGRGGITTRITALHVLGYLALGRGDPAAARRHLEEARELGESMRELQRVSPALWGLAEAALLGGDPAGAVDWSRRGFAASAAVGDAAYLYPFLVTGTRALLASGDPAAADRWTEQVGAAVRNRSIPGTLPAIDHARALVALAHGSTRSARDRLARAIGGWDERGRAWEGIGARIDLAGAETRANRLAEAAAAGEAALERARAIGSRPLVERAESALRSVRARRPEADPWAPLTAREFEVAKLVAAGLTNAQVAAELGLSPKTVGAHVEHIASKLGVNRRAEIAAWTASIGNPKPVAGRA